MKNINSDKKIEFEQDILNILQKYDLYNPKLQSYQQLTIDISVENLPKVRGVYNIVDKSRLK